MGTLGFILPAIGLLAQLFLCAVLARRRVYWQFPFFFAYTVYSIVGTVALLATNFRYDIYYYTYWANEGGLTVLALLALHEVFRKLFFGFYAQFRWFRMLFPAAAIFTVLIVFWITGYTRDRPFSHFARLIVIFGLSVNFMQIGLFCLIMAIARRLRMRWQFAPLGIILGFAMAGIGSVFSYWLFSEFGTRLDKFTKYLSPVAYILAIAIWLDTFFFRPEPETGSLSAATLRQLTEEIQHDAMIFKKFMERFK
jgi:hypothetical protein